VSNLREPESNSSKWIRQLGEVTSLLLQVKQYHRYPLGSIGLWIQPAIFLDQIRIFRDRRGLPVGYVTWAFLSADVAAECRSQPNRILHFSEWNEGNNLWIMDILALPGWGRVVLQDIKKHFFRNESRVFWQRRTKAGVKLKSYFHFRNGEGNV
jgi:cytolysin-activating lysine-acyltransferase